MMTPSQNRRSFSDNFRGLCCVIMQTFWTVFFFFYFLLKGKPEWKCETLPITPKTCCVEAKPTQPPYTKLTHLSSSIRSEPPRFYRGKTFIERITENFQRFTASVCDYGRRIGRFCQKIALKILQVMKTVVLYLWAFLKALFYTNVPSKTLPATPKPFPINRSDSGSFNKVEFNADELKTAYELEQISSLELHSPKQSEPMQFTPLPAERHGIYEEEAAMQRTAPQAMPRKSSGYGNPSYQDNTGSVHQQEKQYFTDTTADTLHGGAREDVDRCDGEAYQNNGTTQKKKDPPGIGKLPADVMAELHGTQKMRQEREASVQREMTQSCHPDMAQWKTAENDSRYDRSASATPFRASSVGPTMRRLEQVVSRLDDTSDNEAQYVFRAKPSEYSMGKAVFTPVEEAERMRDDINRMPTYESRPITPAQSVVSGRFTPYGNEAYAASTYKNEESGVRRRARTVDPIAREGTPRTTSSFYANSPVTSHTVRRTPAALDRGPNFAYDRGGVTQGTVSEFVNRWPPASNAVGAEVVKDDWVKDVLGENDNGLMTTMCRRIVERKTEDKWRWLDEQGHLLDEKNQRTWKGELDTVLRDGPGEAKHWSRTVECLPSGDTRFQDVSRQYSNNFVVESIVRNY